MLWIHPIIQLWATLTGFYVIFLAWQRVKVQHFKGKGKFEWKKHAFWGRIVIISWLVGLVLGRVAVQNHWDMSGVFINHTQGAMFMTPLMLVGYATGSYMDRHKQKRTWLPVIHGLNNILLLIVALYQFYTGYFIVVNFLL